MTNPLEGTRVGTKLERAFTRILPICEHNQEIALIPTPETCPVRNDARAFGAKTRAAPRAGEK